ncbi:hypothetical protein FBR05_03305 [Deltaproteobacteria bacterium PRO3]|nr:hypothetical protein [Deltaproteobacteria bacterium PRO3]
MTPLRFKDSARRSEPDREDLSKCAAFFESFPVKDLEAYPKKLRRDCGDAYFNVDDLKRFELRIANGVGSARVRRGAQLMGRQATYQLASFFLPYLRDPPPGLNFLLDTLRELGGDEKVRVVFEKRVGDDHAGFFRRGRRPEIHVVDTLSPMNTDSTGIRGMDLGTLYHELGHSLMYQLYGGKLPPYRGHEGHDDRARRHWESETNPGAAWSEGFAGAVSNLDFRSSHQLGSSADLPDAWFEKSFAARLSNEYVIAAVLTDYVKSEVPYKDTKMTTVVLNDASYCRLNKIFAAMRASGLQEDFGVFVGDFLRRYPEEGSRLNRLLRKYGLEELAGDV